MFRFVLGRLSVALLLILVLSFPASAGTLTEKVREHTYPNGLKLLMVERHDSPTVAAYLAIRVGAVDETSRNRGCAHLLEHMMFKGSGTLGTTDYQREKTILDAIERTGGRLDALRDRRKSDPKEMAALAAALKRLQKEHKKYVVKDEAARIYAENGGIGFNASTSEDLTTFTVSLPANKLELWAAIESDRMQNAVFREFYTERDVVKEERRRSAESSPASFLYENLLAAAFTVHPYRHPVIGWMSDISHLTLAETRAFYKRYYAPVNTVITLVGDIDPARAEALVGRYFGGIPAGTPAPPVPEVEPPQRGEKVVHLRFEAEPRLAVAFHKPTLPGRTDYVMDLIDQILTAGRTSRLYRALVLKKQLASSVSSYGAPGSRYPNLFIITATPRHPHTLDEVRRAIEEELRRLAEQQVSRVALAAARNRLRVDLLRRLQSNAGLAATLSYYQAVAGDWRYLVTYDRIVAGITPEEIMKTARRIFTPENRTLVTLTRGEESP